MKIKIGISSFNRIQLSELMKYFPTNKYEIIEIVKSHKLNPNKKETLELIKNMNVIIFDTSLDIIEKGFEKYYHKYKKENVNILFPLYINLFHGTLVKKPMNFLIKQNSPIDYFVSPDKYTTNAMKKNGWKNSNIIKSPYPRLDAYNNYDVEKIKKFKKDNFSNVVLFCPSWVNKSFFASNEKFIVNLDEILKKLNENENLIVSNHNINIGVKIFYTYSSNFKNRVYINGDDINVEHNSFFKLANKMITDYSSIVFDFAKLRGWDNIEFYNPILDKNNNKNVIEAYKKQYQSYPNIKDNFKKIKKQIGKGYKWKIKNNSKFLFKKIEKIINKNIKKF